MRYSHSTGLYALAMSTVLGACDNGPTVPASALEQTVAHAQEGSKIDLSTPERALDAVRIALNNRDYATLKQHLLFGDVDDRYMEELKSVDKAGNYSITKIEGTSGRANMEIWLNDGEFDSEGVKLKLIGNQWKASF